MPEPIAQSRPRVHVISLGISDYHSEALNLRFAAKDAASFSRLVSEKAGVHYDLGFTRTLCNDEVHELQQALDELQQTAVLRPHDILLMFISGHATVVGPEDEFFFVVAGEPLQNQFDLKRRDKVAAAGSLSWKNLRKFAELPCRKFFMLDSCFASRIETEENLMIRKGMTRPLIDMEAMVFCATSQEAFEDPELPNSVFAYYLLQALGGRADGASRDQVNTTADAVELIEAVDFVIANVATWSRTRGMVQDPRLYRRDEMIGFTRLDCSRRPLLHPTRPLHPELRIPNGGVKRMITGFMLSLALSTQVPADIGDVADYVLTNDFRRIAVYPEVLIKKDGKFAGCRQVPLATSMSQRVVRTLEQTLGEQYEVLPGVASAVSSYPFGVLHRENTQREIVSRLEADVLIIAWTDEEPRTAKVQLAFDLWPTPQNQDYPLELSLTDLAFAGRSFEVRRWNSDHLDMVGFREDAALSILQQPDHLAGHAQAQLLREGLAHPMEIPAFPAEVSIFVGEEERPLQRVGSEYFVRLSPDEQFVVRVKNRSSKHRLVLGLYIDGLNTLGPQVDDIDDRFQHPDETPGWQLWGLDRDQRKHYQGFYSWQGSEVTEVQRFEMKVVPEKTVRQSLRDRAGMITAIFYADGNEEIQGRPASTGLVQSKGSRVLVRPKPRETIGPLQPLKCKKGLLLGALTIYYRAPPETAATE